MTCGIRSILLLCMIAVTYEKELQRFKRQDSGDFWWLTSSAPSNAGGNPIANIPGTTPGESSSKVDIEDYVNELLGYDGTSAECEGPQTACVPYYQCEEGKVITDGSGIIDIRFGNTPTNRSNSHSACLGFLDVCCSLQEHDKTKTTPITDIPYTPACGKRNTEGIHARILGFKDNQAQFGEFPWMAAILRYENAGSVEVNLYACGGSLIGPDVVLTAAHCVYPHSAENLKVRIGEWDTQQTYEYLPHQDRLVNKVVIHPKFNSGGLWNDYALLFLREPVTLKPHVDTICLPHYLENFDDITCYVTGWGKNKFGQNETYQNVLKVIGLPIVPHHTCEASLRTTRLGRYFKLHESFICAGGKPGKDACKGDGGSPLVCAKPGAHTYYQVGIVAWGIGCGENGIPGVYASIPYSVQWITQTIDNYRKL